MPPGARPINPVGDLAAIYRARIPQPTPRALFGPQAVARIQPNMRRGPGVLGTIANVGKQVISSLDPRFIVSQGGKSVQHVAGDIAEVGRSIISGEDTLSESPSARAYQRAGEGITGAIAAALPYVDVATAVVPTTKLLTPAGRAAMAADAAERVGERLIAQHVPEQGTYPAMSPQSALAEEMAARAMDIPELLRFVQEVRNAGFSANEFPNEFKAVNDYFNQNAPQYQIELRSPGRWPEARPNIALIDRLFKTSAGLQRPTILYRGIKNSNYIPQQKYAQIIKNLKVGDVLEEPGYMSTSIDRDMAEGFSKNGFVFEIEAPAGAKVISPLMNDELLRPYADPERELLLPRNTKLQIVAIDGNTIRARIVG